MTAFFGCCRSWGSSSYCEEEAGPPSSTHHEASEPSSTAQSGAQGPQHSRDSSGPFHMASHVMPTGSNKGQPYLYPSGPSHMAANTVPTNFHNGQSYLNSPGPSQDTAGRTPADTHSALPYPGPPGPSHMGAHMGPHGGRYPQPFPGSPGTSNMGPSGSLGAQYPRADHTLSETSSWVFGYHQWPGAAGLPLNGTEGEHSPSDGIPGTAGPSDATVQLPLDGPEDCSGGFGSPEHQGQSPHVKRGAVAPNGQPGRWGPDTTPPRAPGGDPGS